MHKSDDGSRQVSAVTCYLDESGTHEGAVVAVVGGLILNKTGFAAFDTEWEDMLSQFSIAAPLHMKAFRRPEGRLADISNETRTRLFSAAAKIINAHKIYTIAATLSTDQFNEYFSSQFQRDGIGVYGMCFILCAHLNHLLAKQNAYSQRIAFLMDSGNQYAHHPKNGSRPCALNVEVVIMVQHAQRRRGR